MPLEVESYDSLRDYIDTMSAAQVVYSREGAEFKIVTNKFFWKGASKSPKEMEEWLQGRGAIKVKGWKDLEDIFAT